MSADAPTAAAATAGASSVRDRRRLRRRRQRRRCHLRALSAAVAAAALTVSSRHRVEAALNAHGERGRMDLDVDVDVDVDILRASDHVENRVVVGRGDGDGDGDGDDREGSSSAIPRAVLEVHGEKGAELDILPNTFTYLPGNISRNQQADPAAAELVAEVDDLDVLRLLYGATHGESWLTNDGWMDPAVPHCAWFGISCTQLDYRTNQPLPNGQKRVDKIELSGNNLSGSAPLSVLVRMGHLSVLKLDGNNLGYAKYDEQEADLFGIEFGAADAGLPAWESGVRYLDLSHTDVGGGTPVAHEGGQSSAGAVGDGLGRTLFRSGSDRKVAFPHLSDLYLTGVQLRGPFPVTHLIQHAPNVERLVLDLNDLTGEMPPAIGGLTKLRYLSARDNELRGALPPALGELRKMRYLILRGNGFTGPIPRDLSEGDSLPFLEHLDLSRQLHPDDADAYPGLTGALPAFMTTSNLRQLDLSFNALSGPIPVDFLRDVNPSLFDYAFLGNNRLGGKLPAESLSRLPEDAVYLEDNRINDVDEMLCSPARSGTVAAFGCDAILCRPGTYGPGLGRQEDAGRPCESCPGNAYWGGTRCSGFGTGTGGGEGKPTPRPTPEPTARTDLTETEILLKFYEETGGPGWTNDDGWREAHEEAKLNAQSLRRLGLGGHGTDHHKRRRTEGAAVTSFCAWHGVECSASGNPVTGEDAVEYLLLGSNNLRGQPPPELFHLRSMKTLALADNGIAFSFEGIGEARSLSSLDLANTGLYDLSGIEVIADTLEELRLDGNQIGEGGGANNNGANGGIIPQQIFHLAKLEELSLNSCGLTGPLPPALGLLPNLISLSAADNGLSGPLPSELTELRDLSTLRLRNNRFKGDLPGGLAGMTGLNVLDLSRQWSPDEGARAGFTGTLPSFSAFAVLRKLDLSYNSLDGPVPPDFLESISQSPPVGFEFADLSSNRLDGMAPEIASTLSNVFLKDNQITSIHPAVCASITGMPGLAPFGCDAFLCAPGTYNALGRQTSFDLPCEACKLQGGAKYYGSVRCVDTDDDDTGFVPPPSPTPPQLSGAENDRWILETIYSTCKGESWSEKVGWMDDGADICDWSGVSCSEEGLGLNLRSRGLKCAFPNEAFRLSGLETLILDGNDVDFSFDGIRDAPNLKVLDLTHTGLDSVNGIEQASGLTDVFLTSNGLVGPFPPEILQLAALETLSLAFNALTGTVPPEVSVLSHLRFLDVNNNDLGGPVPASFGIMTQLEVILMQSNALTGPLPHEIGALPNLLFVDLSQQTDRGGYGLTGPIPPFSVQAGLKRLDLSSNNFAGDIPANLLQSASPEDLEFVDLSGNTFSGRVPAVLARFPVDTLYLFGNEISAIDGALCDPNLGGVVADYGCDAVLCPPQTYNEEGRQLTAEMSCRPCSDAPYYGTVTCAADAGPVAPPTPAPTTEGERATQPPPVPATDLTEREILVKFYADCGGPRWTRSDGWNGQESICSWFGIRCSDPTREESVEAVLLSTNNIIGTPPPELFQLPNLETLVLDNNQILFGFAGAAHASRLSTLDLSGTGLFGVDGISKVKSLKELHLASNAFKGPVPSELFVLTSLEEVSLDYNSFSGLLPAEIGMLPNLKLLSAASNRLAGMLPLSLGALTSLITLRLQDNALTGTLPDGLGALKNLAFLDLSDQIDDAKGGTGTGTGTGGFTGPVPLLDKLEKIRRLDLSKNLLTGTLPGQFLRGASKNFFEYADLSSNHISGAIPADVAAAGLQHIYLQDNLVTDIGEYCAASTDPAVTTGKGDGGFGCDAILCPPDTFNSIGRRENEASPCSPCPGAKFYGTTECDGTYDKETPPSVSNMTPDAERLILEKLYDATDGYRWHDNANWKKEGETFCNWKGITCAESGETVREINLGANNVKKSPPAELFRLPNLKVLSLYSNPLSGFNFGEMERSRSLEELLLDATGISSVDGVGRSKVLKKLNLRFNDLTGSFPDEFTKLTTLETLNLAHNRLEGTLPATLQEMTNLRTLLLSGNAFQGKLNDAVFPPSIRLLDFSENELSGSIPAFFLAGVPESAALDLDLHDNLLTGVVPEALGRFDSVNLLLANNFISGIEGGICQKRDWNEGDVGRYGCDGLLCPAGRFAPMGRWTADAGGCALCPGAQFLGTTSCEGAEYRGSGVGRLRVLLPYVSAVVAVACGSLQFFA